MASLVPNAFLHASGIRAALGRDGTWSTGGAASGSFSGSVVHSDECGAVGVARFPNMRRLTNRFKRRRHTTLRMTPTNMVVTSGTVVLQAKWPGCKPTKGLRRVDRSGVRSTS